MSLQDRVAVVTGAASGIGREIAETFSRAGARVVVADLNGEGALGVAADLNAAGGGAIAMTLDVSSESQVEAAMQGVAASLGRIDILVSNAGIQIIAPVEELPFSDWKRVLAVHLDGAFLCTRAVLRHMYRQRNGCIIYMGSVHSKDASPLKAPYVTAKHGLIGLAKVVAKEGGAHGVRTNVICPGFVRTALVEQQIPQQAKRLAISEQDVVRKIMLKDTLDGEFTTVEEIAQAALFLASFDSLALSGQSLIVSHGWFMQ